MDDSLYEPVSRREFKARVPEGSEVVDMCGKLRHFLADLGLCRHHFMVLFPPPEGSDQP